MKGTSKKKILALVLVLVLTLSLLTACGGNRSGNSNNVGGGGNSTPPDSANSGDSSSGGSLTSSGDLPPELERAEKAAEMVSGKELNPSLPLAALNVGDEIENDLFKLKFTKFEIVDIPQLRQGRFAENDPSESYFLQLSFWTTSKTDARVKLSFMDRSINDSIFTDLAYGYYEFGGSVGTIGDFTHKIQFRKDALVELDPATIETVRLHYFVYDVSKDKNNYMEDPFYEGYLVFKTPPA